MFFYQAKRTKKRPLHVCFPQKNSGFVRNMLIVNNLSFSSFVRLAWCVFELNAQNLSF